MKLSLLFKTTCLLFLFGLVACTTKNKEEKTNLGYVDMLIGTAGQGHTIVSTARPFALVKPGPDTEMRRNYLHAKYITGFSQLHTSGTGGNAQSAVLGIMPTNGELKVDPGQYRSRFDPLQATTEPGYKRYYSREYNRYDEDTKRTRQ